MLEKELNVALLAAKSVKNPVLEIYHSKDLGTEIKDDNSPVTRADKTADLIIREILKKEFPNYAQLTEESFDNKERLNNDFVWIVDPIDGTKDFITKNDEFTVNIGLSYKHEAVLGVVFIPATGEVYYGVKGLGSFYMKDFDSEPVQIHVNQKTEELTILTSRFHLSPEEGDLIQRHNNLITKQKTVGSAIKGCEIARGNAEISFRLSSNTKEWDTCAMQAVVEQAGGFILKFDGTPIKYNREDVYNRGGYIICNNKENFFKIKIRS